MNIIQKKESYIHNPALILYLLVLFFLINTHTLAASETVFHQFSTGETENQLDLKEFLYLSISVELLKYDLSSSRTPKGSDYTLKINYYQEYNDVSIDLELLKGRKSLASTTIKSAIDSTFRREISEGVSRLMSETKLEQSDNPDVSSARIRDVIDLDESKPYVTSGGYLSEQNSFGIEVGLAPGAQFYIGEFRDYVAWGLNAGMNLSFIWLRQKQVFGLCLTAWGGRGFNGQFAEGGPLYLSSFGGRFMWGLRTGSAQYIALYGGGGIAPLFLAGQDGEVLVQTCPYFEAGINFRVVRILNFYLDLNLGYKTIMESDMLISSIEPSMSINFEL